MSRSRSTAARAAAPAPHRPRRLGPKLRRAWIGYQSRLDDAMAAAGFADRRFPDGGVLRMCRGSGTTIADIGRELGITRQGAHKIVATLRSRAYVVVEPSTTNGREKVVTLARAGHDYLAAQRKAATAIERRLRKRLGDDAFDALERLLDELDVGDVGAHGYLRGHRHEV